MPESVQWTTPQDLIREILTDSYDLGQSDPDSSWGLNVTTAVSKLVEHVRDARAVTLQMNTELTAENAQLKALLREARALVSDIPSRADDSDPLFRLRVLMNGSH